MEASAARTARLRKRSPSLARPSALRKLLVQASHYSVGGLLTTAAGFISFPFLTRVFPVGDYGLMNLISATLTVLVGIGKLGLQHAIVRFYSEARTGKREGGLRTLFSTALLGMAASGALIALIWVVACQVLSLDWLRDGRVRNLFTLTAVIVAAQVLESCLVNFVRADQLSSQYAKYVVTKKYVGLGLIIGGLLLIARDLRVFYSAMIATELLFPAALGLYFFRRGTSRPRPAVSAFSAPLLREMLAYGVPMMLGYELSGLILSIGDRYVIQAMIGGVPLGIYSAAYNLCQYVDAVFVASVAQAIMPIYMRIWSESGEAETKKFLNESLRYFVILAVPVGAGLSAVGGDFLPFVASEKYASGAVIIPFVMAGIILAEMTTIVGAGLFIQRRTGIIAGLVVGGAALNIGLNLYLVPRLGITGAAIATLSSYAALTAATGFFGFRRLRLTIPWAAGAKAVLAAAGMWLAVRPVHFQGRMGTCVARSALGAITYGALIMALDEKTRDAVVSAARRLGGSTTAA